jgi:hypothetical protein
MTSNIGRFSPALAPAAGAGAGAGETDSPAQWPGGRTEAAGIGLRLSRGTPARAAAADLRPRRQRPGRWWRG